MKKTILSTLGAATLLCLYQGTSQAQMLLINEVYPGGGSTQATAAYHEDFIELLNTGTVNIDVTGFTLAYGASSAAAGTFSTAIGTLGASAISGSSIIVPGGFLLINTGAVSTGGAANPTADFQFTSGASLSATSGAVRLSDASGNVLDRIGWGTTNNAEGTAATAPAISMSLNRTNGLDTNNNSADFTSMTPTPATTSVPEPSTYAAMGLGILGMFAMLRTRRRNA